MDVVSDSDIIIHLSKLQRLALLRDLYNEVGVPEYVQKEVFKKESPAIAEAFKNFIKVFPVDRDKAVAIEKSHKIHFGESNVKALGEELNSSLLLTNEKKVREAAKKEGFTVAGIIGIIFRACKKGFLTRTETEALLEKMRCREFRIHPEIIDAALDALERES